MSSKTWTGFICSEPKKGWKFDHLRCPTTHLQIRWLSKAPKPLIHWCWYLPDQLTFRMTMFPCMKCLKFRHRSADFSVTGIVEGQRCLYACRVSAVWVFSLSESTTRSKITIAQIDLSWLKIRAEITHTHTGRKSCLCDLNPFKHFGSSFFQKWTCLKIALWDLAMDAWQVSASYLTWSSTMIQQSFMMYWCTMWQCVYMMHMYT